MKRRALIAGGALATMVSAARAQPAARPRIGILSAGSATASAPLMAAFRAGLAERGWVEPTTVELVPRFSDGDLDRLRSLARELVTAGVNVVVATGTISARAARDETRTIPIVFTGVIDMVDPELVASLARPGGNVTGLTQQRLDTVPKEVELLAELVPGLARLSILRGRAAGVSVVGAQMVEAVRAAAATRGIDASFYGFASAEEVDAAFAAMAAAGSQAVLVIDTPVLSIHRDRIVAAGVAARLPVFAASREWAEAGALASYGANLAAVYRRTAYFVDRILKGARPAELPVEQPTVFELVINLRTAKAVGLAVPQTLLLRAVEVIE